MMRTALLSLVLLGSLPSQSSPPFPLADGDIEVGPLLGCTEVGRFAATRFVEASSIDLVSVGSCGTVTVAYAAASFRSVFTLPPTDVNDAATFPGHGLDGRDAIVLARDSSVDQITLEGTAFVLTTLRASGADHVRVGDLDGAGDPEVVVTYGSTVGILWGGGAWSQFTAPSAVVDVEIAHFLEGAARQIVLQTTTEVRIVESDGTLVTSFPLLMSQGSFAPFYSDTFGTDGVAVAHLLPNRTNALTALFGGGQTTPEPLATMGKPLVEAGDRDGDGSEELLVHATGDGTASQYDLTAVGWTSKLVALPQPAQRIGCFDLDDDELADIALNAVPGELAVLRSHNWMEAPPHGFIDFQWAAGDATLTMFDFGGLAPDQIEVTVWTSPDFGQPLDSVAFARETGPAAEPIVIAGLLGDPRPHLAIFCVRGIYSEEGPDYGPAFCIAYAEDPTLYGPGAPNMGSFFVMGPDLPPPSDPLPPPPDQVPDPGDGD